MTGETESLILEHLRRIRAVVDDISGRLDLLTMRVSNLEKGLANGLANVQSQVGNVQVQLAEQTARMDSFDERLRRIERRLDLTEVH